MKIKKILKFYFEAEKINLHIDRLILTYACDPQADCAETAEKISILISEKQKLNNLWAYIDMIADGMCVNEIKALNNYSAMRTSIKKLDSQTQRHIRRAGVKFARRARRLDAFDSEVKLINKYYCLL